MNYSLIWIKESINCIFSSVLDFLVSGKIFYQYFVCIALPLLKTSLKYPYVIKLKLQYMCISLPEFMPCVLQNVLCVPALFICVLIFEDTAHFGKVWVPISKRKCEGDEVN